MRYSTSLDFAAADRARREAYAAHDVFATAGDDHSPAAEAASEAEYAALLHMLTMPVAHPGDIAGKLAAMEAREIDASWTDWFPQITASISADLSRLTRDCPSPAMAQAFTDWAAARVHYPAEPDEGPSLYSAAFFALMALPINAPGDLLVKTYVGLIEEIGDTSAIGGTIYEIDRASIAETLNGTHTVRAAGAKLDDIEDSDLGRCMMELGRVDFDAAAWLEASQRAGLVVNVIAQPEGSRAISISDLGGADHGNRAARCEYLLGAGGDRVESLRRYAAVADAIAGSFPGLVLNARNIEEVA